MSKWEGLISYSDSCNSRAVDRFRTFRNIRLMIPAMTLCLLLVSRTAAAGVWTQVTSNPYGANGTMMLLTDGTVIVQRSGVSSSWSKLSPDSSGNYINGKWSSIASMGTPRLYFGSNVLPSGKVFVIGGEYSGSSGAANEINTGEIYDPLANTWTATVPFPRTQFGDDPSVLLPNGKVLCGYISGPETFLYDPLANTWTQTGTKLRSDRSSEENWILLPDGSVLSYDVFASPSTGPGHAQRYIPSSGTWVDAGTVPVPLTSSSYGYELGPASLLPDGRVVLMGVNQNSVIYTPASNSWVQGPSLPSNMGADDAPAAMLPDGTFIFAADTSSPLFTAPTRLFSFDYKTNTITDVTPSTLSSFLNLPAYELRMLVLPNGHLLLASDRSSVIWDYAPSGTPQAAWAPTIVGTPVKNSDGSYTLTGTQLTGISEGATYGDDAEMSTNYPIVRLTSSTGAVAYARTTNWTPGVATGSLQTTVNFTVPRTLVTGTYQLSVVANGIASASTPISITGSTTTVSGGNVTARFSSHKGDAGQLTLSGDANPNSLTVSLSSGQLTVQGVNGTTINGTTSFSTPVSGSVNLNIKLNDGNDSISFTGVSVGDAGITLGAGNDNCTFTLCSIQSLTIDGGTGVDTLTTTSTTIGTLSKSAFP